MNALRNIFLLLALALWGGAMAVASPAGDYDPTLPPEPYALYQADINAAHASGSMPRLAMPTTRLPIGCSTASDMTSRRPDSITR